MSRKYFYKLIASAQELKELHAEATLKGKQAVGLSRGKHFYKWDDSIGNIRPISNDDAAKALGLTSAQIDQIVSTNAEVSFEEPIKADEIDIEHDLIDFALAKAIEEAAATEASEPQEAVVAEEIPPQAEIALEEPQIDESQGEEPQAKAEAVVPEKKVNISDAIQEIIDALELLLESL